MKTTICTLIAAAALIGATASVASAGSGNRATATVEFQNAENFTDFKTSRMGTTSDVQALSKELRNEVNRLAGNLLPAGYHVMLRFTDIDLAGEFEPQRLPPMDDVRILKGVYTPKLAVQYSVTDAAGNVVAEGERKLTDLGFEWRMHLPNDSHVAIEAEVIGDFLREIARSTS